MPSTYSQDLRIELIAAGEQSGTWGSTTNNNLGNLIEDAISGAVVVTINPGTGVQQAITAANGAIDQARCSALILQGATNNFEIFAPPVTKIYVIRNECSFQATLWCATTINGTTAPVGASGYIIPANKTVLVHSPDGVQFYDALNYLNSALPANSGGTGFQTYAVGDLLYANTTTSLAKLPDVAVGNVLRSGGVNTAPAWGQVNLATDVTGNLPVANLGGGSGASSTTFWRGDGTWQTPGGGGNVSFSGTAPVASVNQVAVYGATGTAITTGSTYQFRGVTGSPGAQAQIQLFENPSNGTDNVTIQTPSALGASYTLTLPTTAGTNGYVLQTNGSGVLSWVAQPTVGSGTVTSVAAGAGMNFSTITGTGTVTMGTPSAITSSSTDTASGTTHTHSITGAAFLAGAQTFTGKKTFTGGIVSSAFNFTAGTAGQGDESIYGSGTDSGVIAGTVTISCASENVAYFSAIPSTSNYEVLPRGNGVTTLGSSSNKWSAVWASNGTIQTSDQNQKQDIVDLDDAEKRVAVRIKGLIKKFRFKDAVIKKGDGARIHVGVIAQELQEAFAAEGLDATRYGMFCSDTWWEKMEEKFFPPKQEMRMERVIYRSPEEGATEVTQLAVRYDELLAFVIAAM